MKIIKLSNKGEEVLSKNVIYLSNIWQLAKGLMFTFKIKNPLIFDFKKEKYVSLHMFFVFYPIDVVFLDSEKRIVDLKENFKPFTTYSSKKKAKYVIEINQGTIKEHKLQINDRLDFRE